MASSGRASDYLSRMTRLIWSMLENPEREDVLAFYGCDGIGRSMVVRRVMEEAKQLTHRQLFDLVLHIKSIRWTSQFELTRLRMEAKQHEFAEYYKKAMEAADVQELQRRMVAELGMILPSSAQQDPYAAAMLISEFLRSSDTRVLLIFECYWTKDYFFHVLNLSGVLGVEYAIARTTAVITPIGSFPTSRTGSSTTWDWRSTSGASLAQQLEALSADDAWHILKEEAMDIASNINLTYSTLITPHHVFECFSYLSLFHLLQNDEIDDGRNWIMEYWRCEGLLPFENYNEEELVAVMSLLWLLEATSLFPTRDHVRKIIASFKQPLFVVRCNCGVEKAPEASEWEAANRISLSHNRISTLPLLPNSPSLFTLFLNHNILLQQIPDDFFRNMTRLLVLDLSNTSITSLPSSFSCLRQLRMLLLRNCRSLKLLPSFLKDHMQKLEILDLEDTNLPGMSEASFDGMVSLRHLNISGRPGAAANLARLSVNGCRSLSKLVGLNEVSKLIALDLSGTRIEQLPEQIFNLPSMERLDLLEMEHLKNVPWNRIAQFPKQLNWQRCRLNPLFEECHLQGANGINCLISVSDAAVFQNFDRNFNLNHFQKFYLLVCPCEGGPKNRYAPFRKCTFIYAHVFANHRISARHKRWRQYQRWMEVCGGKTSLEGMKEVLSMADFFYLHDNEFLKTLVGYFDHTKLAAVLCWIEKCSQLEIVFDLLYMQRWGSITFQGPYLLWLSDLAKLKVVCRGHHLTRVHFFCLKHMCLECCPKLINIFSSKVELIALESLEIKFCSRLQTICEDDKVKGQDAFPNLVKLCLWELPKLKKICSGYLPVLKEWRIRGCPLLMKLPVLNKNICTSRAEIKT